MRVERVVFVAVAFLVWWNSATALGTPAPPPPEPAPGPSSGDPNSNTIGDATMGVDRTIVIQFVVGTANGMWHGYAEIKPGDARYDPIIRHVGGLRPGERKAFPDWAEGEDVVIATPKRSR